MWISWRWLEGGDAVHFWVHCKEISVPLTSVGLQRGHASAVERSCWTQHRGVPCFLSLSSSWHNHWLLSENILFPVSRTVSHTWIWLFFFSFTFCCCCRTDRLANLAPWLGADFTNPGLATEAGEGGGVWPRGGLFPLSGMALLAAWLGLMGGSRCQPSSCHAGGLSLRAAAAHLPAAGSGSDICFQSQLWAARRCQSPNASVLDPGARKGFWCQTTAWLAREGRGDHLFLRWWAGRNGKRMTNMERKK